MQKRSYLADSQLSKQLQLNHNTSKMHIFQPKHSILKKEESDKLLVKLNISLAQLPKIKVTDPALPKEAQVGEIIKIERKEEDNTIVYYRVVSV